MADRVGLIHEGRLDLVDSVDNLRARSFTHAEATFVEPPPSNAFTGMPGVRGPTMTARRPVPLEGEIDALLKALAGST